MTYFICVFFAIQTDVGPIDLYLRYDKTLIESSEGQVAIANTRFAYIIMAF